MLPMREVRGLRRGRLASAGAMPTRAYFDRMRHVPVLDVEITEAEMNELVSFLHAHGLKVVGRGT